MIYLFTALYCEANVFIKYFHLEKNHESTQFQEFYNEMEGIRLTVTGIGEIAAVAAVCCACTKYKPDEGDMLINIGTCAHTNGGDGVFLCNKIVELATGKTFYPDILYRHNLCEEMIVTGMLPWDGTEGGNEAYKDTGILYDMEAAAVYQSGAYFFGPHQMVFLKVVSDGGEAKEVSKEKIENLMEKYKYDIIDFIKMINKILYENKREENIGKSYGEFVEELCADLCCSKTMGASLRQHIRYFELSGTDYISVVNDMYREGRIPCKDKRGGKLIFEELKERLL